VNNIQFRVMITITEVKTLIHKVEAADSADQLLDAVEALAVARHEAAIPTLIDVLRFNNPGAAVAAVDGLIAIGEPAVVPILENLDGYNYGARAWATRALAGIGDPRGLELLLDAAKHDFSLSVRRAAARGLGNILWSELPPQEVTTQQKTVMEVLLSVSNDSEWVVRYAAVVGLQSLATSLVADHVVLYPSILSRLQEIITKDTELAVQARAKMAVQTLAS
jgi:phycocyanobilin lyase beta subunit